jgi:hypothetical protein
MKLNSFWGCNYFEFDLSNLWAVAEFSPHFNALSMEMIMIGGECPNFGCLPADRSIIVFSSRWRR